MVPYECFKEDCQCVNHYKNINRRNGCHGRLITINLCYFVDRKSPLHDQQPPGDLKKGK